MAPVSPAFEKQLHTILKHARLKQSSVRFVDGYNIMEASVVRMKDATATRRVVQSN